MDRTVFAACARMLVPLGVLMVAGCNRHGAKPPSSTDRPAVLRELQARAPGPWRRLDQPLHLANVEPTEADTAGNSAAPPVPEPASMAAEPSSAAPETTEPTAVESAIESPAPESTEAPAAADVRIRSDSEPSTTSSIRIVPKREPPRAAEPEDEPAVAPAALGPREEDAVEISPAEPAIVEAPAPMNVADEPAETESTERRVQLPWANAGPRTAQMQTVGQRAEERVRHGFQLAERGATYTARAEFVGALQMIAEASDQEQGTRFYGRSLASGLAALKESGDFARQTGGQVQIDVAHIVAGHKTQLLKHATADEVTSTVAMQRYLAYAREQLAAAADEEPSGSMALYGLARLTVGASTASSNRPIEITARAMALYQASMLADAQNFRAANELGVLMAENNDVEHARDLLVASATISPQPATWHNLAIVYARLGRRDLADQAAQKAATLLQSTPSGKGPNVQWLNPETFASTTPLADGLPLVATPGNAAPAAKTATAPAPPPANPPASVARKSFSDYLPWNLVH